jgi:hypothetical protein
MGRGARGLTNKKRKLSPCWSSEEVSKALASVKAIPYEAKTLSGIKYLLDQGNNLAKSRGRDFLQDPQEIKKMIQEDSPIIKVVGEVIGLDEPHYSIDKVCSRLLKIWQIVLEHDKDNDYAIPDWNTNQVERAKQALFARSSGTDKLIRQILDQVSRFFSVCREENPSKELLDTFIVDYYRKLSDSNVAEYENWTEESKEKIHSSWRELYKIAYERDEQAQLSSHVRKKLQKQPSSGGHSLRETLHSSRGI